MLTVYKASAGSGKTFTLTYEYIKLLLGSKDEKGLYRLNKTGKDCHRSILAITFTNKATAEMKRRIVQELAVLAEIETVYDGNESPYLDRLIDEFGCSHEELKQTAEKALQELLFDFNFFNISTIDSFFQNVLRVFAREAELTGNYEVELDDEYAVEMGTNEMLASINQADASGENAESNQLKLIYWLKKYMLNVIEEGGGFNMFNRSSDFYESIVSFVKKMCDEEFKLNSVLMLKYIESESKIIAFEEQLAMRIKDIKKDIIEKSLKVVNMLDSIGLTPQECLNSNVRGALLAWASGKQPDKLGQSIVKAVTNQDKRTNLYMKAYSGDGVIPQAIEEAYIDALEAMVEGIPRIDLYKLTRNNIYILGLLGNIAKKIDEYRKDNNLILLSDTNDILQRIISEEELPFIYERVGVNLKHFLIDEFQDTSRMQWQNLSPLVSESLSHDNDNLIIGDEKQCIYRFRNSDPSLLREQVGQQFSRSYQEKGNNISGNTNWRSSSDVVKFNNILFTAIAENSGLEQLYHNATQQVAPKRQTHRGYVKFTALSGEKNEFENSSLELMAQEIKRQLQSGYKSSDIAILVRKGSEGRRAIDFLLDYAKSHPDFPTFNILSNEALVVGNSNAVKLIVSILRFIDTPDKSSKKLHSTKREISRMVNRYEFFINNGNSPSEALTASLKSTISIENFAEEVMNMECVSLPSIVERIIARYVHKNALSDENIYITAFQDVVVDYCAQGAGDIHSFLKWWDATGNKACLTFPDSMDAIKVMTIHKSKGLEFRCVHIPFASWQMVEGKDIKWYDTTGIYDDFDKEIVPPFIPIKSSKKNLDGTAFSEQYKQNRRAEIIDQLNATYVAFTRAVDELIVNYNIKEEKDSNKKSSSDELPNNIGYYIDNAIKTATKEYCCAKVKSFGSDIAIDVNDIYVPLNNCFESGVLTIGTPTINDGGDDTKNSDTEEKKEAIPYYTADRNDMWNLSVVEDLQDLEKPRDRGIILHDILGKVRKEEDLSVVVARYAYKNNISEEDANEIKSFLSESLDDVRVKRWFNGYEKVVNERAIVVSSKERYRPDRVVWTSDGTVEVIDYKFGEPHHDLYAAQVRNYMKLLVEMGNKNVKGFIWYLKSGEIVTINI